MVDLLMVDLLKLDLLILDLLILDLLILDNFLNSTFLYSNFLYSTLHNLVKTSLIQPFRSRLVVFCECFTRMKGMIAFRWIYERKAQWNINKESELHESVSTNELEKEEMIKNWRLIKDNLEFVKFFQGVLNKCRLHML